MGHAVYGSHFARLRVANQQIAVEEGIKLAAVADALGRGAVGQMSRPAVGGGSLCIEAESSTAGQEEGEKVFHDAEF